MSTPTPLQRFVKDELSHMPVLGRSVVDDIARHLHDAMPPLNPEERAEQATLVMGLKEKAGRMAQAFAESVTEQVSRQVGLAVEPSTLPPLKAVFVDTVASPVGLTLVGENTVNTDVQIAHCVTEIKAVAEFELRELATFASALCGEQQVVRELNPFTPEVMARALWACSAQLAATSELRNSFIRHGSPRFAQYMRRYYAATCGRLEDLGIQPAVYRTVIVPTGAKVERAGWTQTDDALRGITARMDAPSAAPNPTEAQGGRPFSPEGTMWSGDFAAPMNPRTASLAPTYETQPAALVDLAPPFKATTAAPLAQPLTPPAPPPARPAPAPFNSAQYLGLLNRLFDIILADRRLPRDIKFAIARLQAPAMRLAVHDHTLLNAHDHPLWRLTDQLAWLTETLPGHDDPLRGAEMDFLESTLGQIATAQDQRPELYSRALQRLKDREASRFSATVQRLQKIMAQLDQLKEEPSSGSEPVSPMDATQFETVPSALLDFSVEQTRVESSDAWLATRQVGDHVRLFVDNAWANVRLAWVNGRRDIFLWADCQTPKAWPIRAGAMTLLHNEGLAVSHGPKSLVRAAARLVANQIAQARKA